MPDDNVAKTNPEELVSQIVGFMYDAILRTFALQQVLVQKQLLTSAEVQSAYQDLDGHFEEFRQAHGIRRSTLLSDLDKLLSRYEGPVQ